MVALIKTLQVILALAILILIHEFGHFAFSKMFHIKVEKFFLFFDIGGVTFFSTKKSKWFTTLFPKALDWETEYGIGWLPLGGYCKIAGMIDESMDLETMKQDPQPWEFRTHPAWQRLIVMAGGVFNNFVFAIAACCAILAIWGDAYISNENARIYVNKLAYDMGFRNGDHVISFDDYEPEDFAELQIDLARRNVRKATVLRDGRTLDLYIDQSMIGDVLNTPGMFDLAVPFLVDSVTQSSGNDTLRKGDRIIGIAGCSVEFLQDARGVLSESAGKEVEATLIRGADTLQVPVKVDTAGRMGVYMQAPVVKRKTYSIASSIPAGCSMAGGMVTGYLKDLRLLAKPSTGAYKSVGSFISIGQVFPGYWEWYPFMNILALLSIMLGVMNLIPIPALDGGHILFTIYEILTGRKPSDRFLEIAQIIGMMLIFALMFLAFGNDIGRLIR